MKKKFTKILPLLVLSAGVLCSCGPKGPVVEKVAPPAAVKDPVADTTTPKATGVYDNTQLTAKEKYELVEKLETFAINHGQVGIPLFDDSGVVKYAPRVETPFSKEVPGLGYDLKHGKLNVEGEMGNGKKFEGTLANYLQTATTSDPGTFNYWQAQGQDVSDRAVNINGVYYEQTALNANEWGWKEGLAKGKPIMLDRVDTGIRDEETNHKKYEYKEVESPEEGQISKHWRIKLRCKEAGDSLKYGVSKNSKHYEEYGNREIALADYMTPFDMMFDYKLYRFNQLELEGLEEFASGLIGKEGIGVHLNEKECALDFTLTHPKNQLDAIYTLSSQLYAPVPVDFIELCGGEGGLEAGAKTAYGKIGEDATNAKNNVNNVISTGAYIVDSWEPNKEIVFTKNEHYYDAENIHFDGKKERIIPKVETMFQEYQAGKLDVSSIDPGHKLGEKGKPDTRPVAGNTVFRLSLNATDEETWNAWFGENGKYHQSKKGEEGFQNDLNYYKEHLNPIVADPNFFWGIYYSIDRGQLEKQFAKTPALTFFNESYMYQGAPAFRDTEKGKHFVEGIKQACGNEYGFSLEVSQKMFNKAIDRLVLSDTEKYANTAAKTIVLDNHLFQSLYDNEGDLIKRFIEKAFNTSEEAKKYNIKLEVKNSTPGSAKWMEIYERFESGRYALGVGGIGGNNLDPISLMRVLATDPAIGWGFNLSWRDDTSLTFTKDKNNTLEYNGELFSFDSLVLANEGPVVLKDGEIVELIKKQGLTSTESEAKFEVEYETLGFKEDPFVKWEDGRSHLTLSEVHTEKGDGKEVEIATPFVFDRGFEFKVAKSGSGKLVVTADKAKLTELAKAIAEQRKAHCEELKGTENAPVYKAPTHIKLSVDLKYTYEKDGKTIHGTTTVSEEVKLSELGIKL